MSPQVETYVRRLARLLRVKIKASQRLLGEVSLAVGRHRGFLGKALRQPDQLKAKDVYRVLEEIDLHPAAFFAELYRDRRPPPGSTPSMQATFEAVLSKPPAVDPLGEQTGLREVRRLAEQLQLKMLETDVTQRKVSRALGFRPDHLSQILLAKVDLKFWHVFAVLEQLGIRPRDFFEEMYGIAGHLADGPLPGGHRWSELLGLVRRLAEEVSRLPPRSDGGGKDKPPGARSGALAARLLAEIEDEKDGES